MKRTIAVFALTATGVFPKGGLPFICGERDNSIPRQQYRHPRRRRSFEQPCCTCATTNRTTTRCFVGASYAPSAAAAVGTKFPLGLSTTSRRNRMRVRPQYGSIDRRRQYQERDSRPSEGVGQFLSGETSERTVMSEQLRGREGGTDAGVVNGVLSLPLKKGGTSKIARVLVDNLAMVDSVEVKVSN